MVRKRKFAETIQQEGISRDQISERFKTFGWVPSPTNIDLGEDFIVHIYIDGNPTGKTFHLQAKSVTNIDERKKKGFLVYKLRKQDIFDWEQFVDPVVLIVWDIKQRLGKWVVLEDVIGFLDRQNPEWRNNKSNVNVSIPWFHSTDDKGFNLLKERIGVSMLPMLLNKKDFSLQLKNVDPELDQKLKALSTTNNIIELSGSQFLFPDWFGKWFDLGNFKITIESKLPKEPIYVKAVAIDLDGQSCHHETELIMVERDEKKTVFSNDHRKPSIRFQITFSKGLDKAHAEYFISVSVNDLGKTVYDNRDLLKFVRAFIVSTNRKFILSNANGQSSILEGAEIKGEFPSELHGLSTILDSLCKVQDHVSETLVYPVSGFPVKDLRVLDSMDEIIDTGRLNVQSTKFNVEIFKKGLTALINAFKINQTGELQFRITTNSEFTLLGKTVSLGKVTKFVDGIPDKSAEKIIQEIEKLNDDDVYEIVISNPKVVDIYTDLFMKESTKIAGLLRREFGVMKIFMIGDLIWNENVNKNVEINLVVDSEIDLDTMKVYCNKVSKYPLHLHKLSDLSKEMQEKTTTQGKVL